MKKTTKKAILLSTILTLLCVFSILTLLFYPKQNRSYTALIYVDGKLYESLSLSEVTSSYNFTITTPNGHYNEIRVEQGTIRISSADCPDLLCVKQGPITNNLLPITCLPHHLVIELTPINSPPNLPDAISH
ncbi:MAG: NusG domain II-containing protein [Lachnospiraceae bacterium]|nr:NusG domain II-containing protein [Lachnospiraceae bacterium]